MVFIMQPVYLVCMLEVLEMMHSVTFFVAHWLVSTFPTSARWLAGGRGETGGRRGRSASQSARGVREREGSVGVRQTSRPPDVVRQTSRPPANQRAEVGKAETNQCVTKSHSVHHFEDLKHRRWLWSRLAGEYRSKEFRWQSVNLER